MMWQFKRRVKIPIVNACFLKQCTQVYNLSTRKILIIVVTFWCILQNRNLGLLLVGFGLFTRLPSRLWGHFVKHMDFEELLMRWNMALKKISCYTLLGSSHHSYILWFWACLNCWLGDHPQLLPQMQWFDTAYYCHWTYALCTSYPCIPCWFRCKSYATRELCNITSCIIRKSTVLTFNLLILTASCQDSAGKKKVTGHNMVWRNVHFGRQVTGHTAFWIDWNGTVLFQFHWCTNEVLAHDCETISIVARTELVCCRLCVACLQDSPHLMVVRPTSRVSKVVDSVWLGQYLGRYLWDLSCGHQVPAESAHCGLWFRWYLPDSHRVSMVQILVTVQPGSLTFRWGPALCQITW